MFWPLAFQAQGGIRENHVGESRRNALGVDRSVGEFQQQFQQQFYPMGLAAQVHQRAPGEKNLNNTRAI